MQKLILRHLCFTGSGKEPALLTFKKGLNVLYGASDTGKSFALEAIDFMLGSSSSLRDLPERVGYERIFLGIEVSDDDFVTIVRSTSGGTFLLFEGLHQSLPNNLEPKTLKERHDSKKDDNLSSFLLHKIDLKNKRVRKNAGGETRSFSFRDLCRLCLITEGDIQRKRSPIESGQAVTKTAEYSSFKLLLTGVDDSALVSAARDDTKSQSKSAKIEFIDEMLASYQEKIGEGEKDQGDLEKQKRSIEDSIQQEQQALRVSEEQYQGLIFQRNNFRTRLQNGSERRGEIDELLARFTLLHEHYQSDLSRLVAMRESGLLVGALSPQTCPLCGAEPTDQRHDSKCDGNLQETVVAIDAESAKIEQLQDELKKTVHQLRQEAQSFDRLIPKIKNDIHGVGKKIEKFNLGLDSQRSTYAELMEERSNLQVKLSIWNQISDFQNRREVLEKIIKKEGLPPNSAVDLSSATLDEFSQKVEQILKKWDFPDADRVHFEQSERDLVISGKLRTSRGKGMRAITHAAFTIGLLEFCESKKIPHPGFVVLDSPLLAYREPEGEEDDLRGTDVQNKFYEYFTEWNNKQVLVIENDDPPKHIACLSTSIPFSKNPHQGRYGFFPIPKE